MTTGGHCSNLKHKQLVTQWNNSFTFGFCFAAVYNVDFKIIYGMDKRCCILYKDGTFSALDSHEMHVNRQLTAKSDCLSTKQNAIFRGEFFGLISSAYKTFCFLSEKRKVLWMRIFLQSFSSEERKVDEKSREMNLHGF